MGGRSEDGEGRNTYLFSTSPSTGFLFLFGIKDLRSNSASRVLSEGGGEGDGDRRRLDEEEAVAVFFATAAFTVFFAAVALIALVWRMSCS